MNINNSNVYSHGNEETTIGVKYFFAYVCMASEIELAEIMQRVEFQFLAFKGSHTVFSSRQPECILEPRCRLHPASKRADADKPRPGAQVEQVAP